MLKQWPFGHHALNGQVAILFECGANVKTILSIKEKKKKKKN